MIRRNKNESSNACLMKGTVYIDSHMIDDWYREFLSHMSNGDWAAYKYYKFTGGEKKISIHLSAKSEGSITVRKDTEVGEVLAELHVTGRDTVSEDESGYAVYEARLVKSLSGIHALYLQFKSSADDFCEVGGFKFLK